MERGFGLAHANSGNVSAAGFKWDIFSLWWSSEKKTSNEDRKASPKKADFPLPYDRPPFRCLISHRQLYLGFWPINLRPADQAPRTINMTTICRSHSQWIAQRHREGARLDRLLMNKRACVIEDQVRVKTNHNQKNCLEEGSKAVMGFNVPFLTSRLNFSMAKSRRR